MFVINMLNAGTYRGRGYITFDCGLENFATRQEGVIAECEIGYNSKTNTLQLMDLSNIQDITTNDVPELFKEACNPKSENDMVIISDSVRFIEGIETEYEILHFSGGFLFYLIKGAVEFDILGEWSLFQKGIPGVSKTAKRITLNHDELFNRYIMLFDKETHCNISNDSVVHVVTGFSKEGFHTKVNTKNPCVLYKGNIENERLVIAAREAKHKAELERKEQLKISSAELVRRMRIEEEKKESSKSKKKVGKKVEPRDTTNADTEGIEVSSDVFLQMLRKRGYKG